MDGEGLGFWVLGHCRWAGFGAWGLKRVFFVDCESGSGAFWTRGTARRVLLRRASVGAGRTRAVRGGLAWVSDLGVGGLRERLLAPRVNLAEARASADAIAFKAFECVLSEGFAVAQGVCRCLAVDGFCAWRGLD